MSVSIDWDLEDYGLDAVSSVLLPRSICRRAGVPTRAWHLSLQWKSSLGKTDKVRLLAMALEDVGDDEMALYKKGEAIVGRDAVRSFLEELDSEAWWLGNVGFVLRGADGSTLVAPSADGSFLEFFCWETAHHSCTIGGEVGSNSSFTTLRDALNRPGGSGGSIS